MRQTKGFGKGTNKKKKAQLFVEDCFSVKDRETGRVILSKFMSKPGGEFLKQYHDKGYSVFFWASYNNETEYAFGVAKPEEHQIRTWRSRGVPENIFFGVTEDGLNDSWMSKYLKRTPSKD